MEDTQWLCIAGLEPLAETTYKPNRKARMLAESPKIPMAKLYPEQGSIVPWHQEALRGINEAQRLSNIAPQPIIFTVKEEPTLTQSFIDKAVDTTATLAAAGLGGAILAEQATWAASDHYGGILGEQIAGPIAGVAGGLIGTALGSFAYQSLPTLETVCPRRAEPLKQGLQHFSMATESPAAPPSQMEWIENQRRMLEEQCAATKLAQLESQAAKNVIRDLQSQMALRQKTDEAADKAQETTDANGFYKSEFTRSLETIIKLQQDGEEAQNKIDKMHQLHVVNEHLVQELHIQVESMRANESVVEIDAATPGVRGALFKTPDVTPELDSNLSQASKAPLPAGSSSDGIEATLRALIDSVNTLKQQLSDSERETNTLINITNTKLEKTPKPTG
jgi:hypothetical protein